MTQPGLHTQPPAPATAPAPHASHARDTLDSDGVHYSVYYSVNNLMYYLVIGGLPVVAHVGAALAARHQLPLQLVELQTAGQREAQQQRPHPRHVRDSQDAEVPDCDGVVM